jgi:hypothetical protein
MITDYAPMGRFRKIPGLVKMGEVKMYFFDALVQTPKLVPFACAKIIAGMPPGVAQQESAASGNTIATLRQAPASFRAIVTGCPIIKVDAAFLDNLHLPGNG